MSRRYSEKKREESEGGTRREEGEKGARNNTKNNKKKKKKGKYVWKELSEKEKKMKIMTMGRLKSWMNVF